MTDIDNPFKQFEGIDEARDVQASHQTILEKLLEIERKIVETHSFEPRFEFDYLTFDIIYSQLLKEFSEISFDEKDILSFIYTNADTDHSDGYAYLSGLFSGGLLQILTERNLAQGKRTKLYLNGNGKRFDYLFAYARIVDTLIIENFRGEHICAGLGSYKGRVNQLIGINITGNNLFELIGALNGSVEQVLCVSISGRSAMKNMCILEGYCNQALFIDSNSEDYIGFFYNIRPIQNKEITLNVVGVLNSKGPEELFGTSYEYGFLDTIKHNFEEAYGYTVQPDDVVAGYIKNAKLTSASSNSVPSKLGLIGFGARKSIISHVTNPISAFYLLDRVKHEVNVVVVDRNLLETLSRTTNGSASSTAASDHVSNSTPDSAQNGQVIITGEEAIGKYNHLLYYSKIGEIAQLTRSMQGKSSQEVLRIADELYALRPQFTEGLPMTSERK